MDEATQRPRRLSPPWTWPRGGSRGRCRCGRGRGGIGGAGPPQTGHGMAAEDVASVDVAARAAVGDVVADEAPEEEEEREVSLRTRPRDSRGGRTLRGRNRWTRPQRQWLGWRGDVAVYEAGGEQQERGSLLQTRPQDGCGGHRLYGCNCVGRGRGNGGPPPWTRLQDDRCRDCVGMSDSRMGCCQSYVAARTTVAANEATGQPRWTSPPWT